MLSLKRQGISEDYRTRDIYIGYDAVSVNKAIEGAQRLRSEGKVVELALNPQTEDEARQSQIEKKYNELIYLAD